VLYDFGASASYNALQASINRRLAKRFQIGGSFTWGKALGVQSSTTTNLPLPGNVRQDMYGPLSFDRALSLTINYLYDFPDGARKGTFLDNFAGKLLLNGWQLSGITSLTGGAPINPTYSLSSGGSAISGFTLNNETTGSYDISPRPVFSCNPFNGGGSQLEYINTSCITAASKGSVGNDSGWDRLRGPGYNDWDVSVFKRIKYLGESESRYIQLRLEAFNAINNVQWALTPRRLSAPPPDRLPTHPPPWTARVAGSASELRIQYAPTASGSCKSQSSCISNHASKGCVAWRHATKIYLGYGALTSLPQQQRPKPAGSVGCKVPLVKPQFS
jgi:hypothetical protein